MDAARLGGHLPSLVTAPKCSWWLKLKIADSDAELSIRRRPPTAPPESFHTTKTRCEHRLQSSAGLDSFADWGARIASCRPARSRISSKRVFARDGRPPGRSVAFARAAPTSIGIAMPIGKCGAHFTASKMGREHV